MASQDRAEVYARITAEIVAAIEAGTDDYHMPWHHDGAATARPINVASGKRYRGVNVLALWVAAHSAGYPTGLWGTYRQWHELSAQVRKGERSTTVVFWKQIGSAYSEDKQDDAVDERPRFLARGYPVFNQAQVDGYVAEPARQLPEAERIAYAEAFYANLRITTVHGGDEAFFRPSTDTVHMPPFGAFKDAAAYYSVLYHEGIYATAAPHRLDRDLSGRFGSEATPWKRWSPTRDHACCWPISASRHDLAPISGLYRIVVEGAQERPIGDLHRGQQGPGGRRLDARPATASRGR
jgi:antirestriction protein ArdC